MKATINNYEGILLAKQERLIDAIKVVQSLIKKYIKDLPKWDALHSWDFNLLHDLEDRLTDKANEVHSEFCSFNWQKNGFNVY